MTAPDLRTAAQGPGLLDRLDAMIEGSCFADPGVVSLLREVRAALTTEPPRMCRNGHPFEPGVDIDDPEHPDPRWCNVCGEATEPPADEAITDAIRPWIPYRGDGLDDERVTGATKAVLAALAAGPAPNPQGADEIRSFEEYERTFFPEKVAKRERETETPEQLGRRIANEALDTMRAPAVVTPDEHLATIRLRWQPSASIGEYAAIEDRLLKLSGYLVDLLDDWGITEASVKLDMQPAGAPARPTNASFTGVLSVEQVETLRQAPAGEDATARAHLAISHENLRAVALASGPPEGFLGPLTPQGAERCSAQSPKGRPCVLPAGHEIRHAAPRPPGQGPLGRERWDDPVTPASHPKEGDHGRRHHPDSA